MEGSGCNMKWIVCFHIISSKATLAYTNHERRCSVLWILSIFLGHGLLFGLHLVVQSPGSFLDCLSALM